MNNLLITGTSGFVGANLVPYLSEKDFKIMSISRRPDNVENINYSSLTKDVWNRSNAIIHLAGKAHDLKSTSNDDVYYAVNTELTKNLFDQFIDSKASVFIYISSVKAAADEVVSILSEGVVPNPVTVYGKSKLLAESYLLSKTLPKNKKLYILRPCMIHGPGNKGNLNVLYKFVKKGIPYPFGSFENKRSFLSIENLCFVIYQLLEIKPESGVYNVADDEALSSNMLVKLISEVLHKKARILKLPPSFVMALAKLGTKLNLPINEEKIVKLTGNYVVSNAKIKSVLETDLPMTAEKGLKQTIISFK